MVKTTLNTIDSPYTRMATIRQRPSGTWEIIIRRKGVLPKPCYSSADTKEEAEQYAETLERLLDQGIVPTELQEQLYTPKKRETIKTWADRYLMEVHLSESDRVLLNSMLDLMDTWPVDAVSMDWAHKWIQGMKQNERLAPGTIRHKAGAVASTTRRKFTE